VTQGDPGAANRELTARIARLTWIGRIVSVAAGLAVVAVVVVLLIGSAPAPGAVRHGRRGNATLLAVLVVGGFLVPFLAARALFRWLLAVRRRSWIAELAAKHGCDAEKLRRLAEAISELA
jgi:hypothetical protein